MARRDGAAGAGAEVSKYLGVGLTWALSTIGFLLLGRAVDGRLGTDPAFTLIGAFVGAAAGFYWMIHHLLVEPRRRAEREVKEDRDAGGT